MKAALLAAALLTACSSTPQLNLKDGETGCVALNSLVYGKASVIVQRADNVGKNQTQKGDIQVTCGEAVMSIKTDTGVVVPPGATTTTTTTVVPSKPTP